MTSEEIRLTGKQIAALAELVNPESENVAAHLEQTHSDTGGTHLYARAGGKYVHIAKNGNVVELDT